VTEEARGNNEGPGAKFKDLTKLGELLTLGLTFALSIVIGVLTGHYVIDGYLGTAPWGVITFTIFGVAAGFINLYRTSKKYIDMEE
jgi:ATP synthase protein I